MGPGLPGTEASEPSAPQACAGIVVGCWCFECLRAKCEQQLPHSCQAAVAATVSAELVSSASENEDEDESEAAEAAEAVEAAQAEPAEPLTEPELEPSSSSKAKAPRSPQPPAKKARVQNPTPAAPSHPLASVGQTLSDREHVRSSIFSEYFSWTSKLWMPHALRAYGSVVKLWVWCSVLVYRTVLDGLTDLFRGRLCSWARAPLIFALVKRADFCQFHVTCPLHGYTTAGGKVRRCARALAYRNTSEELVLRKLRYWVWQGTDPGDMLSNTTMAHMAPAVTTKTMTKTNIPCVYPVARDSLRIQCRDAVRPCQRPESRSCPKEPCLYGSLAAVGWSNQSDMLTCAGHSHKSESPSRH